MRFLMQLSLAATALASRMPLPAYPLAVKNPYLSTWFPGGPSGDFPKVQPFFWKRNSLTWNVIARVDSQSYCLMGCTDDSIDAAEEIDREFTSTHTFVTLQAGSATLVLDFFSPVSLKNYVRQSIPFSYLTVSVQSAQDVGTIDVFSAIDDTWTGQTDTKLAYSEGQTSRLYKLRHTNAIPLTEVNDMAAYGHITFAANTDVGSVTHQTGPPAEILSKFTQDGLLDAGASAKYAHGNLVAFSYRIKNPTNQSAVTFAVGLVREPTIMWLTDPQVAYWKSAFDNTEDVVDHFFSDEAAARTEADALDSKVRSLGRSISANYSDILESTVRQIWGGFELTIPQDTKDTKLAKAFIKEISTDGNVNTLADLIPKALPALYVLEPEYIRLLLEPIMEYTLQWPANFAFHDLGKHYPNATGETVEAQEKLLLDQTSVLQWMVYSYQKVTGNTEWAKPYMKPLKKYANYLVRKGLYPPSQRSSVDSIEATPNQTVLAIYSAIGLSAYGAISGDDFYTQKAQEYAPKILDMGTDVARTHIKAHYNDTDDSWISTYPFAFDVLLGLNTFNSSVFQQQSDFYEKHMFPYGMQFYHGVNYTVAELAMWCGSTSSTKVLNQLINGIHRLLSNNLNVVAGPTQWNVTGVGTGHWFFAQAKSIVGSYFMPVAIQQGI